MKLKPGAAGWIATGLVILTAELMDERTMSEAFCEFSKDPRGKYVVLPLWAVLTAHLFGVIPLKYDPIHNMWVYVKGQKVVMAELPEVQVLARDI